MVHTIITELKPGEPARPGHKIVAVRSFQGCIVCGADSNQRCSACAAHGLDWMKFCSPKCQKEVWFLHKRVCGIKAIPFRWPGFTRSELEDIEGIGKRKFKDRMRSKKEAKLNRKGLIPNYDSIRREGLSKFLDPGKDQTLPLDADRKIVELRNTEFQTRTLGVFTSETSRMDGFTKGRAAILHNPINYMIYHQETFFPGLAQGFPDEPEKPYWWVMFQHTYLIYYATLIHAYKDPEKNYDHAEMCASVIKGSMSNLVERTHPGAWKELHGWTRVDKLGPFPGDPAVGLFPEGHPLAWMKRPESEDDSDEEREHDEIPENCRIA